MQKVLHKFLLGVTVVALTSFAHAQSSDTSGSTSSSSAATAPAATNPANSAATDPFVQRRLARKQAKAEYNAKKKVAKQQYKEEKKAADANLKASGATAAGVQRMDGTESQSSGSK